MYFIGFTGTRHGMTTEQEVSVRLLLEDLNPGLRGALHHGDCVGADAEAHRIAVDLGITTMIHPPSDTRLRAYCRGGQFTFMAEPYTQRNRSIVEHSDVMIACPSSSTELRTGGTWQTVRMARGSRKRLFIVWPDGSVKEEP